MEALKVLNAKEAIAKHVNWKIVLQFAIVMKEQLTPEQISAIQDHRVCSIGRWLDSHVNLSMGQHAAFRDLAARHMQFHQEMIFVSQRISQRRFEEAAISIRKDSRFAQAGLALAQAITAFDQVAKVAVPL